MNRLALVLLFALAACRKGPASTQVEEPTAPVNTTMSLADTNSKQDAEPMDKLCAFVLEPPRTVGALETALGIRLRDPLEHEHWTGTVILPVQSDDAVVSSDVDAELVAEALRITARA